MIWKSYSQLKGLHSRMSPSNPAWLNYDDDKIVAKFASDQAAKYGTEMHDLAAKLIHLGVRLPDDGKTMDLYVNHAIGFRMRPEQTLFYSENAFGTTDAIIYRQNILRIHDLKTGLGEAGFRQLMIYAALFCLDYIENPFKMDEINLRIYQNDDFREEVADPGEVVNIMEKIKHDDKIYQRLQEEAAA